MTGFFFAPKKRTLMKLIRIQDVLEFTGLSRSVLYVQIANATFPQSLSLSGTTVVWLEKDIQNWILSRIEERNNRIKNKSNGDV